MYYFASAGSFGLAARWLSCVIKNSAGGLFQGHTLARINYPGFGGFLGGHDSIACIVEVSLGCIVTQHVSFPNHSIQVQLWPWSASMHAPEAAMIPCAWTRAIQLLRIVASLWCETRQCI